MKTCLTCNKITNNPKFCSRNCAAIYNNRIEPKRKAKLIKCKNCNNMIKTSRTFCLDCSDYNQDMTISKAMKNRVDGSRYNKIRFRARTIAKNHGLLKSCFNCGYTKHVECCHIKDISAFDKETLVSIVNAKDNLIGLCPNCHWELDNGLLQIKK